MSHRSDVPNEFWARLVVGLGFFAAGAAVLVAHATPATGYEVSIYAGTPVAFWLGAAAAIFVAVVGGVFARTRQLRTASLGLGGTAVLAIVLLPVVRSYYFLGSADSLSHLGWIRDVASGAIDPISLFYPAMHVTAVLVGSVTGARLPRAAMLVVAATALVYVLFVTLSVRALSPTRTASAVGAVSAFLLLPVNLVVTKLAPHPISQASLYFALVFFLFVTFLTAGRRWPDERMGAVTGVFTGTGVLLLLSLATLLLYHPQAAAMTLVLFGAISVAQLYSRRRDAPSRLADLRPLYVPTLFLGGLLAVWTAVLHPGLAEQGNRILVRIGNSLRGTGGEAGAVVGERGASLQQVGGSLGEIFLKLFLVDAVYVGLAGILVLWAFRHRFVDAHPDLDGVTKAVGLGFLVVGPWAAVQFVGDISTIVFRYLGVTMVVASVLGAITVTLVLGARSAGETTAPEDTSSDPLTMPDVHTTDGGLRGDGTVSKALLVILLVSVLALSLATLFPSAFVYQPSLHVTEAGIQGYERTLDVADPALGIANTGFGVDRYRQAIGGTNGTEWGGGTVASPEYDHDLVGYLRDSSGDGGQYLVVTDYDRARAVEVYRGLRHTRADFRSLEATPGVHHVLSNGDLDLYLYDPSAANRTATGDAAA